MVEGYQIVSEKEAMDVTAIHAYLTQSYWAKGIDLETVRRSIDGSLSFGIFTTEQGSQVGYARVITDCTTFAYLADVYVLEKHRGKALSKWLMQVITDDPRLQGLRRILLATRDAHGLYQQFGFTPLADPEILMERWQPDIYQA